MELTINDYEIMENVAVSKPVGHRGEADSPLRWYPTGGTIFFLSSVEKGLQLG
jgi:hypothetical protein